MDTSGRAACIPAPVEGAYVWMLRYIELNPVRTKLTISAEEYWWSSARYHLGREPTPEMLDLNHGRRSVPFGYPEFARLL